MLSRNYRSADKRNGPQAVPKSSESSYIETFSLLKSKESDTCSLFCSHSMLLGIEAYGLAFAMQTLFYTRLRTIILLGAVQGLDANKSVV